MSASLSPDYRWPGEWEPHAATLLAWPHRADLWSGQLLTVQRRFIEMMAALLPHEPVWLLVPDDATGDSIRQQLAGAKVAVDLLDHQLRLLNIPTNDIWIRDYGPLQLHALNPATGDRLLAYTFNGWGHKFEATLDNQAAGHIAAWLNQQSDFALIESDFVLEGGAIESNGDGLIMTTEACLLHPNRNPGLVPAGTDSASAKRTAIQARLLRDFHARELLWLPGGLSGDDTDGHIDMVARFTARDRVLACLPDDPAHPSHAALAENLAVLKAYRFAESQTPLQITTLPMPPLRHSADGELLPESYANFYIANGCVLVPVFGDPATDARALEIIAGEFPNRQVVPVSGSELILEGGGIHCMTSQLLRR